MDRHRQAEVKKEKHAPGSREELEDKLRTIGGARAERRRAQLAEIQPWIQKKEDEVAAERKRRRGVGRPVVLEPDAADRNPHAAASSGSPGSTTNAGLLAGMSPEEVAALDDRKDRLRRSRGFFDAVRQSVTRNSNFNTPALAKHSLRLIC